MKTQELTVAQVAAVESNHKNVLCVAGPGSGKTTVLAARIRRIIDDGADPRQILAITYTNAAARNLEGRITWGKTSEIVGDNTASLRLGFAGTLHGFCLRMLRDHGTLFGYGARTGVIDEDASRELLTEKAEAQACRESIDKLMKLKAQGRPLRILGQPYTRAQLVVLAYCEELRESGLLDFDLILTEFRRLLREDVTLHDAVASRFTHIFWDEVQDSGHEDWNIAVELPIANKFFVGDPDQSIFGFRGAAPHRLLTYAARTDVCVLHLEDNFRCAHAICKSANRLIRHNTDRLKKETKPVPSAPGGGVHAYSPARNEGEEVAEVMEAANGYFNRQEEDGTLAILCRSNAIASNFRAACVAQGFQIEAEPSNDLPADWPLARALIEFLAQPNSDTLAFFYVAARAVRGGATSVAARKTAHTIRREAHLIGKSIAAQWFDFATGPQTRDADFVGHWLDKEGLSRESVALVVERMKSLPVGSNLTDLALAVVRQAEPAKPKPAQVTVSTIHAAKGREWDAVIVAGYEDQLTPGRATSADVEEERRLAFVAVTRARKWLFFSSAATRRASWGHHPVEERDPSRFIKEALG